MDWTLLYNCAKCRTALEFFLFREGSTLRICGRAPIEVLHVPPKVPKDIREYVSKALIAADTGNVFAGIFFLRVTVELFFRSQSKVMERCSAARPSGEEMGDAYNAISPLALKTAGLSLKELYSTLSDAIHGAKEDRPVFYSSYKSMIRHFKARALAEEDLAE